MPEVVVVFKDGTWKRVLKKSSWEYENDPDWLVSISLEETEPEEE